MKYKDDYYGFVYLWYDTKHKKFIIGSHHGSTEDGYITGTGGVHVQRIFSKRPETMKRKILAYNCDDCVKTTRQLEQYYLDLRPNIGSNPKYYNINNTAWGGVGGWDHVNNNPNKVNPMSTKEGKDHHKKRMREIVDKDPHYFSRHNLGDNNVMRRPEVRDNHPCLFTTENNPMNDPEIRRKAKEIHTKKSGKPVVICNKIYDSIREAARELDMSPQKLRHRLKSDNFPDHCFIGVLNG